MNYDSYDPGYPAAGGGKDHR